MNVVLDFLYVFGFGWGMFGAVLLGVIFLILGYSMTETLVSVFASKKIIKILRQN